MAKKLEYKDKPRYKAIYGIEGAFSKKADDMFLDIAKDISLYLLKK